jgi:hypothetical protein
MSTCVVRDISGRWQGVNRRYSTDPRCVWLTWVIRRSHLTLSTSPDARTGCQSSQVRTFVAP